MTIPITERRQIENEMIFRRGNEKVGIALDEIDAMHRRDGDLDLIREKRIWFCSLSVSVQTKTALSEYLSN